MLPVVLPLSKAFRRLTNWLELAFFRDNLFLN